MIPHDLEPIFRNGKWNAAVGAFKRQPTVLGHCANRIFRSVVVYPLWRSRGTVCGINIDVETFWIFLEKRLETFGKFILVLRSIVSCDDKHGLLIGKRIRAMVS